MKNTIELLSGKDVPVFSDLTNTGKLCFLGELYADKDGNYYVASGYQAYKFNPKEVKIKDFDRYHAFVIAGVPRYLRVYDNDKSPLADRYTAVFGKHGKGQYVGFGALPFHPALGIYQHGESGKWVGGKFYPDFIDRPTYAHLGKKIKFTDLNEDCQRAVLSDYLDIFNLPQLVEK
jgi:hypothetical protein